MSKEAQRPVDYDPLSALVFSAIVSGLVVYGARYALDQLGYTEIFSDFAESNGLESMTETSVSSQTATEYERIPQEPYVTFSAEAKFGLTLASFLTVMYGSYEAIARRRRNRK
jgi:hypothetical protein